MTVSREVIRQVDHFLRAQAITTTPAGDFGWTAKDTSSAGTPTYLCVTEDGGSVKLTLAATSEEEIVTLFQNDVLPYDLAFLQYVEFVVKVAAVDAVTTLVFGVSSAQADTEDDHDDQRLVPHARFGVDVEPAGRNRRRYIRPR
jgi:hypothetical protein